MSIVLCVLALLAVCCTAQQRPPNYSLDDMPDTNFDCRDKILGGYYADPETDCQMFHVCVKVAGVGVQDFRFLCPNDTSFDQENQICANWFDIDCEATTLYYSDNFDLYRIGHVPSNKVLATSSATAIPLGPSTARPPIKSSSAPRYKPRPNQNIRTDEEEDFYLQRSETGDRRLQHNKDLLRGSSSANFFNNNKGKDEDDYEVSYQQRKQTKPASPSTTTTTTTTTPFPPTTVSKKKIAVRKLRKRPQASQFVQASPQVPSNQPSFNQQGQQESYNNDDNYNSAPSTFAPSTYNKNYNNYNNPIPSTFAPSTYKNYNNYSPTTTYAPSSYNNNYNPTTKTASTFNKNYNYNPTTAVPSTYNNNNNNNYNTRNYNTIQRTGSPQSTTQYPEYSQSTQNNYQQRNTDFQRNTNNYQSVSTTVASTSNAQTYNSNYNNNYQQRNTEFQRNTNYQAVSTTLAPTSNAQAINNNYQQRNNDYQRNTNNYQSISTTVKPTSNAQTYNYQQRNTDSQRNTNNYQSVSTTVVPTLNTQSSNDYRSTSAEDYSNYYNDNNDYRKTNLNNAQRSSTPSSRNNNFAADDEKDESLKTAPSNNYRPGSFNNFPNTYDKTNNYNNYNNYNNTGNLNYQKNYNSNVTPKNNGQSSAATGFSVLQKQTTAVTNDYNHHTQTTLKPTQTTKKVQGFSNEAQTSRAKNPTTTTYNNQQQQNSLNAVSSTTVTPHGNNAGSKIVSNARPSSPSAPKSKDVSYDYAYYDEGITEYDGLDPISDHHFGKGKESLKVSRSTN